ncbi:MAG: hypothetical protein QME76_04375 [Bacillota bacterium]|nr:hypothetical protein [Bacillota bacterium]
MRFLLEIGHAVEGGDEAALLVLNGDAVVGDAAAARLLDGPGGEHGAGGRGLQEADVGVDGPWVSAKSSLRASLSVM